MKRPAASHGTAARPAARTVRRLRRAAPRLAVTLAAGTLLVTAVSGAASAAAPSGAARAGHGTARVSTATRPIDGTTYVAMGDSYTSGPLIPDLTGSPAGCARSTHDYPHLVAAAIGATSFSDVSCQGADTTNMLKPESVPLGTNPPQDNALSPGTTLVTLQIGGNDINFSNIIINCTTMSLTDPFGDPCKQHYTRGGIDRLKAAVNATALKVTLDLEGIHLDAPNARVFVVGYPAILPNSGDGCWPVVPIAYGDVPYLRGVEKELNAMLASVSAAHNATFVDTYTASIGHDACESPGAKWVEGLVPTSPAAPFHPNARGEQGMATQVVQAIG